MSAQQVHDHCKYNTGCNFHQIVYQYMKQLYAGENDCIKRVPPDWNKSIIELHYGDQNKKQGNKNKSKVPKQKKRKRKEK